METASRRYFSSRSGTSPVEYALLAPLFIMLFLGMAGYGVYLGASHSVHQIAADAARIAIAGLNEAERRMLAADFIRRNASSYLFVDPEKLTIDTCDSANDSGQFVVALSYDAGALPIWSLLHGLPIQGKTIFRQSTIRIGGT